MRMAKMKKIDNTKFEEVMEQLVLSCIASESVNTYNHYWKLIGNIYECWTYTYAIIYTIKYSWKCIRQ